MGLSKIPKFEDLREPFISTTNFSRTFSITIWPWLSSRVLCNLTAICSLFACQKPAYPRSGDSAGFEIEQTKVLPILCLKKQNDNKSFSNPETVFYRWLGHDNSGVAERSDALDGGGNFDSGWYDLRENFCAIWTLGQLLGYQFSSFFRNPNISRLVENVAKLC